MSSSNTGHSGSFENLVWILEVRSNNFMCQLPYVIYRLLASRSNLNHSSDCPHTRRIITNGNCQIKWGSASDSCLHSRSSCLYLCHLFLLSAGKKFSNAKLNWIIAHDKIQLLAHRVLKIRPSALCLRPAVDCCFISTTVAPPTNRVRHVIQFFLPELLFLGL